MAQEPAVASLEQQAIELARRGDFGADARRVNDELTRLAPGNQGAWTRLARCCLELGLLDEATSALDSALQVNPQNTIARNLHAEVARRRAGPAAAAPRRTRAATPRAAADQGRRAPVRTPTAGAARRGSVVLAGIGRAEFGTLAQLAPAVAAEALSARLDPLLMSLNDRPFAARVVEARNRAGHAGVRLFRRGSILPGRPGNIYVHHQGGRWEPQMHLGLLAAAQWRRDAVLAGIAFDLAAGGADDRAEAGRERLFRFFEAFQRQVASTWRVHLSDWLRANGGFVQHDDEPPATDRLPNEAVAWLVQIGSPAALERVFIGRGLFADRGEDIGIMTDGPRLLRWIEGTFTDLLPLWSTVYRGQLRG